jgi:hypothetical protein
VEVQNGQKQSVSDAFLNVVLTHCANLIFVTRVLQMQSYSFFLKKRENKLFFCFLSLKKQATIFVVIIKFNQILFSLVFRSKVVAAPIQVQFSSNPSPIGNWKYIVFALSLY